MQTMQIDIMNVIFWGGFFQTHYNKFLNQQKCHLGQISNYYLIFQNCQDSKTETLETVDTGE